MPGRLLYNRFDSVQSVGGYCEDGYGQTHGPGCYWYSIGDLLLLCDPVHLHALSGFIDLSKDILASQVGDTNDTGTDGNSIAIPPQPAPCG